MEVTDFVRVRVDTSEGETIGDIKGGPAAAAVSAYGAWGVGFRSAMKLCEEHPQLTHTHRGGRDDDEAEHKDNFSVADNETDTSNYQTDGHRVYTRNLNHLTYPDVVLHTTHTTLQKYAKASGEDSVGLKAD